MLAPEPAPELTKAGPLTASIELLPKQIPTIDRLKIWLPVGTRVYVADTGTPGTDADMLVAARHLRDFSDC